MLSTLGGKVEVGEGSKTKVQMIRCHCTDVYGYTTHLLLLYSGVIIQPSCYC